MEIKWLGHSTFQVQGTKTTIIHDPYHNILGYKLPKNLTADIVICSHQHQDHNNVAGVQGDFQVVDKLNTYQLEDLTIQSVKTYHDKNQGKQRGDNIIFVYTLEDITIAHLGDLGHLLTTKQLIQLPKIDILMIPCGGGFTINAQEAKIIIEQINPKIVLPMHFRTKALGPFGLKFEKVEKLIKILSRKLVKEKTLKITKEEIENKNDLYLLDYKE
ncbi:MAG: MBL fold metallo-hydrolase [Mycoplasmatales bacterium]